MWTNWAGNQSAPQVTAARTVEELRQIVINATGPVRCAGAGHSFTPVVADGNLVIDPSGLEGPAVISVDGDRVRVKATEKLNALSLALAGHGKAFRNLGDINVQSLAGAMGTATHGTGADLPCISGEMTGARLMTATGDIVDLAPDDIPGARVSLGMLGILLEIEMTVVPAYDLRRQVKVVPLDEILTEMEALAQAHRHFEFFWLPYSGKAIRVIHDISDKPRGKPPMDLDNIGVRAIGLARSAGRLSPGLRRWLMSLILALQGNEDYVGESWRVLSKPRDVKFVEMEYHLPPDAAPDVIREVASLTERRHPEVYFPIEVRRTAGDDGWLSPFQGGGRVSVAVHVAAGEPYEAYFRDVEAIFRAVGGRPHWGKMHSLKRADLEALYPDLPAFDVLRARLDPGGRFLSPAMREVFGS